jgi:putative ABC transport system ATP-binding protein
MAAISPAVYTEPVITQEVTVMSFLEVRHVQKIYTTRFGGTKVQALTDVNFTVEKGEYVAIMGESGSGKTTLLNILAALDKPTGGEVVLDGRPLSTIPEREIAAFRRSQLGFVFQEFNLLDTFSVQDNIFLPLVLAGKAYPEMAARLAPIARQLGIAELLQKFPYELSGGQKQRVAVARALITQPKLVLADEPTGALDSKNARSLMEKLSGLNADAGTTILMVTHDCNAASYCKRILFIQDGVLFHELRRDVPDETQQEFYGRILAVMAQLGGGSANVL